jgi:hypothetical protein
MRSIAAACGAALAVLACATSPESPAPAELRVLISAEAGDLQVGASDTLALRFWNERLYSSDGYWTDVRDSLEATWHTQMDTVNVLLQEAGAFVQAQIAETYVPPGTYVYFRFSMDCLEEMVLDGVTIPVVMATEENTVVVPDTFSVGEKDVVTKTLYLKLDESLERHGDEYWLVPVFEVRDE